MYKPMRATLVHVGDTGESTIDFQAKGEVTLVVVTNENGFENGLMLEQKATGGWRTHLTADPILDVIAKVGTAYTVEVTGKSIMVWDAEEKVVFEIQL